MHTIEILTRARALIADKSKWTRGAYGRRADGSTCWGSDDGAVQWCAFGALQKVCGSDCVDEIVDEYRLGSLINANDMEDGHERVLAAFDRAIASVPARAQAERSGG